MSHAMRRIKVLDFSMGIAGPHAAMLCAQHGADVVKVEPLEGDWCRVVGGSPIGDLNPVFVIYNRGKRSLAVNLKDPAAIRAIQEMARKADVIIQAYRPGVMKKFGLDYERVSRENPKVVYLSVTGFGEEGPLRDAPAVDSVLQAFSGVMYGNRDASDTPQRVNFFLIDILAGLYGFQAIVAALLNIAHDPGAQGTHIDGSLMRAALAFQADKILENHLQLAKPTAYVPMGVFASANGHVALTVRVDEEFVRLCQAIDAAELLADARFATAEGRVQFADELLPRLKAALKRYDTDELCRRLIAGDVLHSLVNSYSEMLSHPQVQQMKAVQWQQQDGFVRGGEPMSLPIVPIPGTDASECSQAPHIGQHSRQVLANWGVDARAVDVLAASGAIKQG